MSPQDREVNISLVHHFLACSRLSVVRAKASVRKMSRLSPPSFFPSLAFARSQQSKAWSRLTISRHFQRGVWNGYMFILSEETSTKQIFEQTLSLVTVKFVFNVLRCQTTKGRKKYIRYNILQIRLTNYRNCEKYTKISKTTYNSGCLLFWLWSEARIYLYFHIKYAWFVKHVSVNTYLLILLLSPNFYVKNMLIMQNSVTTF